MSKLRPDDMPERGRRALLRTLLAAPAVVPLVASGASQAAAEVSPELTLAAAVMGLISTTVCSVLPATTEGPYYIDPHLVRSNVVEDRTGIPLRMQLQVVTADCRPVKSARIDIWHCDAQGDYSGYAHMGSDRSGDTTGKTFLRGTQFTDDHGIVTFETIYPGWYRGRTTHIHYKVFLDEKTVLTSQIFFPDALSEYVYLKHPAYTRSEERDTLNAIDGIAGQAGEGAYCAIREQPDRYIAALVVGIDPAGEWHEAGQGMAGGPPPGGPPPGGPPPEGAGPGGPPPGGPAPGGPGGPNGGRDDTTRMFPEAG